MEGGLSIATRLAAHPTSAISDALDELQILGALSGIAAQREGIGRVCGRALPVRFVRKANDPAAYRFGGGVGKPLELVLKTMKAGDFVVMDLDGATNASAWGGLASRLAQRRGVRGTILWGTCRDLEEIRAVGYPVWAVGAAATSSRSGRSTRTSRSTASSSRRATTWSPTRAAPCACRARAARKSSRWSSGSRRRSACSSSRCATTP
jgi:regulator of RNase E activity RraA